jgi:hypothetical protein
VGILWVSEQRNASLDLERAPIIVGLGRKRVRLGRRGLRTAQAVGGAGGKTIAHVDIGDDGRAIPVKQRIAASVITVKMRVDEVFDRLVCRLLDCRFDLVVQRRKFTVHHDHAIVADGYSDVATFTFQHVRIVTEIGGLDLRL